MAKDIPEIFSGTVEVDETYLGGQCKNTRKTIWDNGTKRGRGTKKQPVFGIVCRKSIVWADVVDDVEAGTLQPLIPQKVSTGSIVSSDTWKDYTESLREDTSIVSSITAKNSTSMEKEIISMVWRDSGVT